MSSVDFYRRVPKDLTEVNIYIYTCWLCSLYRISSLAVLGSPLYPIIALYFTPLTLYLIILDLYLIYLLSLFAGHSAGRWHEYLRHAHHGHLVL